MTILYKCLTFICSRFFIYFSGFYFRSVTFNQWRMLTKSRFQLIEQQRTCIFQTSFVQIFLANQIQYCLWFWTLSKLGIRKSLTHINQKSCGTWVINWQMGDWLKFLLQKLKRASSSNGWVDVWLGPLTKFVQRLVNSESFNGLFLAYLWARRSINISSWDFGLLEGAELASIGSSNAKDVPTSKRNAVTILISILESL